METLINKAIQWHHDRNLLDGSADAAQHTKLVEEVKELLDEILADYKRDQGGER